MPTRLNLTFILLCGLYGLVSAQTDTLAIVHGEAITTGEFKERFELTMYPGKGADMSLDRVKRGFLLSMVAERLLAADQRSISGSADSGIVSLHRHAETIFSRDALYRAKVLSTCIVTEEDVRAASRLSAYLHEVAAYYFLKRPEADQFYRMAKLRTPVELAEYVSAHHVSFDTLELEYGTAPAAVEQAVFGHPVGFVSPSVLTNDGYVVFAVLRRTPNVHLTSLPPAERDEMVAKILRNRIADRRGRDFLRKAMRGVTIHVDPDVFTRLVLEIQQQVRTHTPGRNDPHYHLATGDISSIAGRMDRWLEEPIFRFQHGSLSLRYALDQLPSAGFTSSDTTYSSLAAGLSAALRFSAQNYFLDVAARKQGFQYSLEVQNNVHHFEDAYLAQRRADEVAGKPPLTKASLDSFMLQHKDIELAGIRLKVRTFSAREFHEALATVEYVQRMKADFMTTDSVDRTPWSPALEYGEYGALLARLSPGAIYGPVVKGGEFLLFMLLDKRSDVHDTTLVRSISSATQLYADQMRRRSLNTSIAALADRAETRFFFDRLEGVNVTPTQMLTFRYIGFGGKILALPPLVPLEEWFDFMTKKQNVVP